MSIKEIRKRLEEAAKTQSIMQGPARMWHNNYLKDVAYLVEMVETMNGTIKPEKAELIDFPVIQESNGASQFDRFWAIYPRKEKKKDAQIVWKRKKLDALADLILNDVNARIQRHGAWKEGFIPHPTTYLNGERWNDEIVEGKNGKQTSLDKTIESLQRYRPV